MDPLKNLDWKEIRDHYDQRKEVHRQLVELLRLDDIKNFSSLSLGISDPAGNYSANEHHLGPKIVRGAKPLAKVPGASN